MLAALILVLNEPFQILAIKLVRNWYIIYWRILNLVSCV